MIRLRMIILALAFLSMIVRADDAPAPGARTSFALELQATPDAPRDRFTKVEAWLLECYLRCDDQVNWTAAGGSYRYSRKRVESLVASIELKKGGGKYSWYGTGEARMSLFYLARSEFSGGDWYWNKSEGSGVVKVWADLNMHGTGKETGKIFTFNVSEAKGSPGVEGTVSSEGYKLNNQYKWELTNHSAPARCHDLTSSWAFNTRHPLPDTGLNLSGSSPFPVAQEHADHPANDMQKHHIDYPHQGSIRWRLVPLGTELLDVVIDPPDGYKEWLPVAGASESQAGSHVQVKASLVARDGKPPTRKARKFIFELVNASAEPGICINHPVEGAASTPDLAFEPDVSRLVVASPLSVRGETAPGQHVSATALVSCFDYGAYADLKVSAEMEDGEIIDGYVRDDPSRGLLPLPYREAGSHAAAAWIERAGAQGLGDSDDSESEPVGDRFKGDGLTLYEEYRGFMDRNGHRRADPKKKELFVSNRLNKDADPAFAHFERLSGMVVRLLPKEIHPDREINFNRSKETPFRCKQHLVILEGSGELVDQKSDFTGGATIRENNGRKKVTPVSVKRIVIKTPAGELVPAFGADLKEQKVDYRQIVIVHELLHSVGVDHHGGGDSLAGVRWSREGEPPRILESGKPIEVFREAITPVPLKPFEEMFDKPLDVVLAVQNGAFSGDQSCIMRYAAPHAYVHPGNRSPKRFYIAHEETPEAWGLDLCSTPEGTGVNAPGRPPQPRYGKATLGRCQQQLRVSDADP